MNSKNTQFFIQMSGFPGSGKSTLSRKIAERTGAIIVDHDIIKSAVLNSVEAIQIDGKSAGKMSYNIDWSLIEFYLSQGRDVIFDSPCLYQEMVDRGMALCEKYNVTYKYVECYLNDFIEINKRLKNRERMVSQISEVNSEEIFEYTLKNSKKPIDNQCLIVDTSMPLEHYIHRVLKYVNE